MVCLCLCPGCLDFTNLSLWERPKLVKSRHPGHKHKHTVSWQSLGATADAVRHTCHKAIWIKLEFPQVPTCVRVHIVKEGSLPRYGCLLIAEVCYELLWYQTWDPEFISRARTRKFGVKVEDDLTKTRGKNCRGQMSDIWER